METCLISEITADLDVASVLNAIVALAICLTGLFSASIFTTLSTKLLRNLIIGIFVSLIM